MNKFLLLIVCLMISVLASAQTIAQKGVAYRYNGKHQRTPLGNVTISYDANQRSTLSSSQDGTFSLTLSNLRMGDRIGPVMVKKREMMVFNQQAVDEWSIRKDPLMLVLCNADEFEKQKENLINIGKREAKKKYDCQKADLEAKLNASEIQLADYEKALDKAYEELEQLNKNIGQYADLFARIDESEIDTIAQKAMDLFKQGLVEEALQKFEAGQFLQKLKGDIETERNAEKLISIGEKSRENAKKAREERLKAIHAQIEAYKFVEKWEDAAKLYKGLADLLHEPSDMFEYAYLCYEKGLNLPDGEKYYLKVIQATFESKEYNVHHLYLYATAYNNLGVYYQYTTHNYEKAELYLKKGIEGRREYARRANGINDEGHVGWSLVSLASLYIEQKRYTEGKICLKEAEAIYEKIAPSNREGEGWPYGRLYDQIGWLYLHTKELNLSEDYYKKAWSCYKECIPDFPEITKYLTSTLVFGIDPLYKETNKYQECAQYYDDLDSAYIYCVAKNKKFLKGYLYFLTHAFHYYNVIGKAEKKELILYKLKEYAKEDYTNNLAYLIEAIVDMSNAYFESKQYSYCVKVYEDLFGWMDTLPKGNELTQITYLSLSYYSIFTKEYNKAERYARKGIDYAPSFNLIYTNLAASLLFQGRYKEAEELYNKYKNEFREEFLDDFEKFEKASAIPIEYNADVKRIKKLLNEN